MTILQWRAAMMAATLRQAILLADMSGLEDIKIEPEQIIKNIAATQSVLHDALDIFEDVSRSSSINSIPE